MTVEFRVAVGEGARAASVSARLYEPARDPGAWLILAPGAGAGHDHPFMAAFGRGLASRGLRVVTFNFPYIEQGRRVPDPNATLEACWVAVLRDVARRAGPGARLFAGGKSMGGRIASQVAASPDLLAPSGSSDRVVPSSSDRVAPSSSNLVGERSSFAIHGLVFLGYPLHPPARPDQRRTSHWPALRIPALFVQGSRDPFATLEEIGEELPRYGGEARLLIVEEGDHSFKVPRRAGRSQDAVHAEIQDAIAQWVAG